MINYLACLELLMNARTVRRLLLLLLINPLWAAAEDIDLFVGATPPESADYPNVIILIDNTSNWAAANQGWPNGDKQGRYELDAIITVLDSLAPANEDAKINLGIMFLTQSGNNSGGYVRSKVQPMTVANRASLKTLLTNIDINSNAEKVPSSTGYDQAMFEVFKYFGGYTSVAHANDDVAGTPTDATHFGAHRYSVYDSKSDAVFSDPATRNNYIPVIAADAEESCSGKNFLIIIGNGWPSPAEKSGNSFIGATLLGNVGGNTTQVYSTTTNDTRYADEMARFLHQTDVSAAPGKQSVVTYAIDVFKNNQSTELTTLLRSMSEGVGGGKYFEATSAQLIVDSLSAIISEIQSTNSVFASVSLPVSVNTQGTYLNQVFIGMFRPDSDALPRWFGNLKQYRLGRLSSGGPLKLLDAGTAATGVDMPASAISSSGSGFIAECARSSWTPLRSSTADGYWINLSEPNCTNYPASSNTPDGNLVEKGGQAYQLRSMTPSSRVVKTCSTCGDNSALTSFVSANTAITKAALGNSSMSDTARSELIDWARGLNTEAESIGVPANTTALTTVELKAKMRPSSHGDVVHSRPVAVNYASSDAAPTKVVVFYGGNDGMLRAVNGNRDGGASINNVAPGNELWSFVAPESYSLFQRNKDNSSKISFPNSIGGSAKTYGFDGPITAYKTSSAAWVFAAMRRGGRMVYAFDVTTPESPSLKWARGCTSPTDNTTCDNGFSAMGQTWSEPTVLKSAGYTTSGTNKPMVIFGAGYDSCEDADPATSTCKSSGQGHAIYLLDADTGTRLNTFDTDGAVIADATVVNDANGLAQYIYTADLSGNVYRISGGANTPIGSVDPAQWTLTKIAALGGSGVDARKFMFTPDVVLDSDGSYVILLGSGDREKPLGYYDDAANVENYFFMLRDKPTNATWLSAEEDICPDVDPPALCLASLYPITTTATPTDAELATKKGWYLELAPTEQVVTSALTILGGVNFSTHMPSVAVAGSCTSDLGNARSYQIDYKNAKGLRDGRFADLVGDGLPPSPVGGLVTLDDNTTVPFCIGCSATSPLEGGQPTVPATASQPKSRVFWNIEK